MAPSDPLGPVDPACTEHGLGLMRQALRKARGMTDDAITVAEADRLARQVTCTYCGAKPWAKCIPYGRDLEVEWVHPSRRPRHP